MAYRIQSGSNGSGFAVWEEGTVEISINEVENEGGIEDRSAIEEAVEWIKGFLSDGAVKAAEAKKQAIKDGISDRTLNRAKKKLGVKTEQRERVWWWQLSEQSSSSEAPSSDVETEIADSIDFERPLDRKTLEWLASFTPDQRKKLSDKGLIEADDPVSKEIPLSQYLPAYFESHKSELKKASWISYQHTRKRLEEFFKGRTLPSITAMDAKAFRQWLETSNKRDKPKDGEKAKPLAINTIKRRTGLCRQIFKQAIEDGLISRNPFVGMSTSVRSNKERQHYIPIDVFSKVLEKAPNATWRSLLVLARLWPHWNVETV